jgi:SAM-dependent methyltransferase
MAQIDPSNGWEALAPQFIATRELTSVGVARIHAWARLLPAGAAVLDLGCGPGGPRSEVLVNHGFALYAIDASPTLAEAYRAKFPNARVVSEAVERSGLFGRTFDGVLAWGLLFLLPVEKQLRAIQRIAEALTPGGRLLFTAPAQVCEWADLSTGRPSVSLGRDRYRSAMAGAGLVLAGEYEDEGENHYYDAIKE